MNNIILCSDSYKLSHYRQYPSGTEHVFSYFESRGGEFDNTVFFGLQYIIKKYLKGVVVTSEKIEQAETISKKHGVPFNKEGWEYILKEHEGKLPVRIKAVPEGTVVPIKNVLMTVENTDAKCFWLTNYLESLLVQSWYASTVATLSREMKKLIGQYCKETGGLEGLNFKLHDFGFRGVSSVESAGIGGAAHLVNFMGTDTLAALTTIMNYYNEDVAGYSIPASEHSTMTSWGRENELDAYRNMLDQYPTGLVACVSDSYNIYEACDQLWGRALKEKILSRDGTIAIRPDSGHPPEVVIKVLSILERRFGCYKNGQGYKVLPPQVRIIQGDGIDYEMTNEILGHMKDHMYSTDNIAFGMGGGLLQKLNRDTQQFAFKCSSVTINGKERDVYKRPFSKTPGLDKSSKKGRISLFRNVIDGFITRRMSEADSRTEKLFTVFENGELLEDQTFKEIRARAEVKF